MKQKNLGFTLVELIIVIAILAILSTGAIAGYSVYVKQANMAADKALVAEIENALVLAGYSGTFDADEGGYLILSTEGISGVTAGSHLDKALQDAFGADYANAIKLKYDGWNASFISMDAATAQKIANSSYVTGSTPEALMQSVSGLTNTMSKLLTDRLAAGRNPAEVLLGYLDEDAVNSVQNSLGLSDEAVSNLSTDQLANFTILAIAAEQESDNGSALGLVVNKFAQIAGFASSDYASESEKQGYETMVSKLTTIDQNELNSTYEGNLLDYVNGTLGNYLNSVESEGGYIYFNGAECNDDSMSNDEAAFAEMLKALNSGSGTLSADDLSNKDLATSGALGEYFGQYVNAAKVLNGATGTLTLNPGEIAVFFTMDGGVQAFSTISG